MRAVLNQSFVYTIKWLQVFLFKYTYFIDQLFPCDMNNLHTAVWFQITNYIDKTIKFDP